MSHPENQQNIVDESASMMNVSSVPQRDQRFGLWLLLAGIVSAALVYLFPLTLPTPLLEPDEGLHATITQEMVEHDEWIVPIYRGQAFLDKPILYFWAQMLSLKAFGMNESAVRFPGLMFGLLGSLTTGLLAYRLFNARIGLLATLISMTMCLPAAISQAATHDVAMVPWTNLALLCLWEMEKTSIRRSQLLWWIAASFMIGLAILTKALIGVAIVGVAFATFLAVSRRITFYGCVRLATAYLLGLGLATPWFIAMEFRNSGYLYYYFIERHVLGFATSSQPHGREPWHFYLPFITLGALPWIWSMGPLPLDGWQNRRQQKSSSPEFTFLLCWLMGGLLFLSVARSKLSTYALPLFPAIAILAAVSWQRFYAGQCSATSGTLFIRLNRLAGFAGVVLPAVVLAVCQSLLNTKWPATCWLTAIGLAAMSIVSLIDFEQHRYERSFSLCCVWVAGMIAMIMAWPLQTIAETFSERSLAEWLNRQESLPPHLFMVGEKPASVIFYLRKDWRLALQPDQFVQLQPRELTPDRTFANGDIVALTDSAVEQSKKDGRPIPTTFDDSAGQFHILRSPNDGFQPFQPPTGSSP